MLTALRRPKAAKQNGGSVRVLPGLPCHSAWRDGVRTRRGSRALLRLGDRDRTGLLHRDVPGLGPRWMIPGWCPYPGTRMDWGPCIRPSSQAIREPILEPRWHLGRGSRSPLRRDPRPASQQGATGPVRQARQTGMPASRQLERPCRRQLQTSTSGMAMYKHLVQRTLNWACRVPKPCHSF